MIISERVCELGMHFCLNLTVRDSSLFATKIFKTLTDYMSDHPICHFNYHFVFLCCITLTFLLSDFHKDIGEEK